MKNDKIDIVVTWVDGNDPEWLKEKAKFTSNKEDNSATSNRFRDWDLTRYWFRGIEKYAPWVNHVFFVTCGHYPEWLNLDNPKLVFVKHEDYIPAEVLPTFNSNTIEMYMHKIDGLSEKFVLFNDDQFLISPTSPRDFFDGDLPCESALLGILSSQRIEDVFPHIMVNNNGIINKYFSKKEVLRKNWTKFFNLKYGKDIIRNIALLPFIYFSDFRDLHLATSHLKRNYKKVWDAEPTYIFNATKSKYRSTTDVSHWLIKQWYICSGEFSPRSTKWGRRFELGIDHDIESYILGHKGKIVCLNDSEENLDFYGIQKMLKNTFDKILPDKSSFEK